MTLPSCSEFQALRAFAVLSTFFAALAAVLVLAELIVDDKPGITVSCSLTLAWICGVIAFSIWYDQQKKTKNLELSFFVLAGGIHLS